jgi:hypothetical protein
VNARVGDVDHPVLGNAGARIESLLTAEIERERGVGDFDHQSGFLGRGMPFPVVVGLAGHDEKVGLRL